jgi:hypothetical protein
MRQEIWTQEVNQEKEAFHHHDTLETECLVRL